MKRTILLLITLFLPLVANAQDKTGHVSGTVVDAATQNVLVGVNVVIMDTPWGTATNADGHFALERVPAGTYRIAFQYLGYTPFIQSDVVVRPGRTTVVDAGLRESILEIEGVAVDAGYYQKSDTELTSVMTFSTEEIRRSPGAAQEIVRVLNALPGVASRGETSQDLFVRGGSPMENGFYIDNIFIPNTAHFSTGDGSSFGPTGLINTEFVERIDFYTGGFSAAYGDRLSSISAIEYREGNAYGYTGEVGLNFSGGLALLEGPWANDKGTFFVSGRRSYLDLVASAINAGGAPSFGDLQGKVTLKPNARHTVSLLNLYGQSGFVQDVADARDEGESEFIDSENRQNTMGLTWKALWTGEGVSNTAVSYSFRNRDFIAQRLDDASVALTEQIRNDFVHLRNTNFYQVSPRFKTAFGGEVMAERGTFDIAREAYTSRTGIAQPGFARNLSLDETRAGVFGIVVTRPLSRLQLTTGLRADYASLNENIVLSPRASASYQLTSRLAFNASAGLFHQTVPLFIRAQRDDNEGLAHLQARHLIAGIDYMLTPSTKFTLEAYDKQYRDVPQLAAGNPLGDPTYVLDNRGEVAGQLVSDGSGYARGIDVMVQKKLAEKIYGLASASFFRSRYTDYQGIERNRVFDTRVLFNVIGGYKPNDVWELSVRWSYAGGRPTTPIDEAASLALGDEVRDAAQFHAERLPAYHSLFVRADRRFNFRATNLVMYISLWNAYSRANVEDTFWNVTEERVDERNQFSLLPIVGLEFEF